jgi:hypothetical protein
VFCPLFLDSFQRPLYKHQPLFIGSLEYLCPHWKIISRTSSLCRCRISLSLGTGCLLCPGYAKGKRYRPFDSYWCQCGRYWTIRLASREWLAHFVKSVGEDQLAVTTTNAFVSKLEREKTTCKHCSVDTKENAPTFVFQ